MLIIQEYTTMVVFMVSFKLEFFLSETILFCPKCVLINKIWSKQSAPINNLIKNGNGGEKKRKLVDALRLAKKNTYKVPFDPNH